MCGSLMGTVRYLVRQIGTAKSLAIFNCSLNNIYQCHRLAYEMKIINISWIFMNIQAFDEVRMVSRHVTAYETTHGKHVNNIKQFWLQQALTQGMIA